MNNQTSSIEPKEVKSFNESSWGIDLGVGESYLPFVKLAESKRDHSVKRKNIMRHITKENIQQKINILKEQKKRYKSMMDKVSLDLLKQEKRLLSMEIKALKGC